jgi:hypothetical protein
VINDQNRTIIFFNQIQITMNKNDYQVIRNPKTSHEQVVQKRAFDENKKLYAPYVAISWAQSEYFELVNDKLENKTPEPAAAPVIKSAKALKTPEPAKTGKEHSMKLKDADQSDANEK